MKQQINARKAWEKLARAAAPAPEAGEEAPAWFASGILARIDSEPNLPQAWVELGTVLRVAVALSMAIMVCSLALNFRAFQSDGPEVSAANAFIETSAIQ